MGESKRFKVLMAHNHYLEPGGEDESFEAEKSLLLKNAHEVCLYIRSNQEIKTYAWNQKLSLPLRTISARDSRRDLQALIASEKPLIAHFNNTFPLISPGAYDICQKMGVPVVQNLRNYRLVCPNALFFRDHHVCEDCLAWTVPVPAIVHACYRNSRVQSAVVVGMLSYHRLQGTWRSKVNVFVALTEFSRSKYIAGGIPAEKIIVKPNFVSDRGVATGTGEYALFIGRLDEGKGVFNLIEAWHDMHTIPLKIVGDGPAYARLSEIIREDDLGNVELLGRVSSSEIAELIKGARFVVFPSLWYEAFPRVFLEAFAAARTVVASRMGASPEIVADGRTGLLFEAGNSHDLAEKVSRLWSNPSLCMDLGNAARREYELKYTPEIAYRLMMNIYDAALLSLK